MRTLVYSPFFPKKCGRVWDLKNTATLGIGSNVGNSKKIFEWLWLWFAKHRAFSLLTSSPLYLNPPFGYHHQAHFYNATLSFKTALSVLELFSLIFYLERRWGRSRKRAFKNAPRTLDIDVIFFNRLVSRQAHRMLPHPEWSRRESVLVPLILGHLAWREAWNFTLIAGRPPLRRSN